MIAVDTNILVHAHREDSTHHAAAREALSSLAGHRRRWAVPWPCVHEFLAVVTHPRIFRPPTPTAAAHGAIQDLLALPGAVALAESSEHLPILGRLVGAAGVLGPRVHDARVAAICIGHGVDELWTADRDFSYFPELRTRNPLVVTG